VSQTYKKFSQAQILIFLETKELIMDVNNISDGIVQVLDDCAKWTVPMHRKQFLQILVESRIGMLETRIHRCAYDVETRQQASYGANFC